MMQKFLLIVVTTLSTTVLFAQAKKTYNVNPGQKLVEAIPELYRYPEFKTGTVSLRNGTVAIVKLNHHSIYSEIQYIDPQRGDTISLAQEKNIRFVAVEKDTFYFDETWLEQITNNGTAKLAKRRLLELTNKEKLGAMDSPSFATETYSKYTGSQQSRDLVAKERLTYTEKITYYFGNRFSVFEKASKKSLLNLYRSEEKKIEKWLSENKTDFANEEDLKRLFDYLQNL